jgi:hypothetical protein
MVSRYGFAKRREFRTFYSSAARATLQTCGGAP